MPVRRTFVPDALGSLGDRVLLSEAAALPRGPVALSALRFNMSMDMVRNDFELFATSGNFERLRASLARHTVGSPFAQADGLGVTINAILSRIQADLASGAPRPVAAALHQVEAAVRADVQARIADGTVVVTRWPESGRSRRDRRRAVAAATGCGRGAEGGLHDLPPEIPHALPE